MLHVVPASIRRRCCPVSQAIHLLKSSCQQSLLLTGGDGVQQCSGPAAELAELIGDAREHPLRPSRAQTPRVSGPILTRSRLCSSGPGFARSSRSTPV